MSLKRPNFLQRYVTEHARQCVAALGRQWRDPFSTLLTALVVGITLALPAGLHLLVDNLRVAAGGLQQTRTVTIFLSDSASPDEGQALASELAKSEGIASAEFTSRTDALTQFRERSDLGAVLDALGENPLPASIALVPEESLSTAQLQTTVRSLYELDLVETVQQDSTWSARLDAALAVATRLAVILAIGLAVAAVLAMGNTIRLDIESRRKEVVVMKLIGAPPGFIRRPFLYAGFWYGLSGGLIAILTLYIARFALQQPVQKLVALYEGAFAVQGPEPGTLLIVLAAGVALGLSGAWLAVSRHLGRIELR